MNRIVQKFQEKRQKKEGVLIPFITAGDPDIETSIAVGHQLFNSGADILELGIPFSDPIADGPTIQASYYRALQARITPLKAMMIAQALKDRGPLVFMTYYNIILKYGITQFFTDAKKNGIDGVIIPDLPFEESQMVYEHCRKNNIALIYLLSPITDIERMKMILQQSQGFVYLVSTLGTTGAKETISPDTKQLIDLVRELNTSNIPLAVGFGISKPEQVRAMLQFGVDGVIVGSAIINYIDHGALANLSEFISALKKETQNLSDVSINLTLQKE